MKLIIHLALAITCCIPACGGRTAGDFEDRMTSSAGASSDDETGGTSNTNTTPRATGGSFSNATSGGTTGITQRFYADPDGDGFGTAGDFIIADQYASPPPGYMNWIDGRDSDNCPSVYNPDQKDSNGNGLGDACENQQNGTGGATSVGAGGASSTGGSLSTGGINSTGGNSANTAGSSARTPGTPCSIKTIEQDGPFDHGLEASPNGFMLLRNINGNYRGQFWNLDGELQYEESLQGLSDGGSYYGVSMLLGSEDGFLFSTSATGLNPNIPRLIRYSPQGKFVKSIRLWSGLNAWSGNLIAFRSEQVWDKILFNENDSEVRDGTPIQTSHYGSQIVSSTGELGKTDNITTEQMSGSSIRSATSSTKDSYGFLKIYTSAPTELGIYNTIYGTYRNISIEKHLLSVLGSTKQINVRQLISIGSEGYYVISEIFTPQDTVPESYNREKNVATHVSLDGIIGATQTVPLERLTFGIRYSHDKFWIMDQRGTNGKDLVLIETGINFNIQSETVITDTFDPYDINGFGFTEYGNRFALGWSQFIEGGHTNTRLAFVDCR